MPVHDGIVLHKGLQRTKFAGDVIDQVFLDRLFGSHANTPVPSGPQAHFEYEKIYKAGEAPRTAPGNSTIVPAVEQGHFIVRKRDLPNCTNSFR